MALPHVNVSYIYIMGTRHSGVKGNRRPAAQDERTASAVVAAATGGHGWMEAAARRRVETASDRCVEAAHPASHRCGSHEAAGEMRRATAGAGEMRGAWRPA